MKFLVIIIGILLFTSNLSAQNDIIISEVNLDTVKISHNQTESNCCSILYTEFAIDDSVITITEIDTGSVCDCLCLFDIQTTIGPLKKGNYTVYIYRDSNFYGSTTFEISEEANIQFNPQIVKFHQSDCGGSILAVGSEALLLKEFHIKPIYPNPFNPTVNIHFYIPQKGLVEINIFNQLGELVTNLLNKELSIGDYNYTWNGNNLSSGMYFIQIRYKNIYAVKKAMLVK